MAAFIQKLFKSRKTPTPPDTARNQTPSAGSEPEASRVSARDEQRRQLEAAPDQHTLAELAIGGVTADIRLQAATRLTEPDQLQRVHKQAKGRDKGVFQATKQSLQKIRDELSLQARIADTVLALIAQAEDQARSEDTKLYEARLNTLLHKWSEVERQATPEQLQQFLEAVHRCRERLDEQQTRDAEAQRQQDQARQRTETLALLKTTLDDLKGQPPEPLPSLSSLDALQKTQENRWLEATRETAVGKQEQKAYEASMLTLRNYVNALRRLGQAKDTLSDLSAARDSHKLTDDQRKQATELAREIAWPEGFPVPALLEAVRSLSGTQGASRDKPEERQQQTATARDLEATCTQLEGALEARQLKESKQLLKTAQQQLKALDERHGKPFRARLQLLTGQLRELSDWQGFATEPKQIALCEQMEYLAEQPMEPEAKSERIKELQNEWRTLGGSSDRTLWTRFKAASDEAYEPCKAYFQAKSGLKQANLQKREAICHQLETFLTGADWASVDWKAAERIHQTARQEWKAAWPVEFRDNRQVQKRFDELLKQLEAPLNQERQRNEALKQAIVEKAEALVDHEPLQDAMNQAKALQSDWKTVGITRHREDRKLWQAFRKACDLIFARRDAQRTEQQQASEAADAAARTALDNARDVDGSSDRQTIEAAQGRLSELDTSTLSPAVKDRCQHERQRLARALESQRLAEDIAAWQALILARAESHATEVPTPDHWNRLVADEATLEDQELVIRAEILSGLPSPEQDQQRRMEIQVQRLADGMGASDQDRDRMKALEKLVALWCLKREGPGSERALADRLNTALAQLIEG